MPEVEIARPDFEKNRFMEWILARRDTPYLWGGKGLKYQLDANGLPTGLDCSGLVTAGLFYATNGRLDWRADHNCTKLATKCAKTNRPREGTLVFYGYGSNMLTHVMVYMTDGRVYGATGGNSDNTNIEYSIKKGHKVTYRSGPMYRPGFKFYADLPI